MNNKELIKEGHERAAELKGSFAAINACSVAQLISDLASQLDVQLVRSNALAAKLSMINGLMDAAEQANKLAQEATEKLVQERDALAAEVQAVRWACGQVYVRGYNHGHLNTADGLPYADEKDLVIRGGETLYEFTDPDHCGVAADAILAEVRAQAVELCADSLLSNDDIGVDGEYQLMREFAAQLRQGDAL